MLHVDTASFTLHGKLLRGRSRGVGRGCCWEKPAGAPGRGTSRARALEKLPAGPGSAAETPAGARAAKPGADACAASVCAMRPAGLSIARRRTGKSRALASEMHSTLREIQDGHLTLSNRGTGLWDETGPMADSPTSQRETAL